MNSCCSSDDNVLSQLHFKFHLVPFVREGHVFIGSVCDLHLLVKEGYSGDAVNGNGTMICTSLIVSYLIMYIYCILYVMEPCTSRLAVCCIGNVHM